MPSDPIAPPAWLPAAAALTARIAAEPPPAYTPAYPAAPANMNEPPGGTLTVQEILQLRGLKKRIGGENLKRVVDALAE